MEISEIKVSYSSTKKHKPKITSSRYCFELLLSGWNLSTIEFQEEFKVMLLNRRNQVLGVYLLSKGGSASTIVDPKLIFSVALKCNASSIIIAHNHPSGNLNPSDLDIKLTKKLKSAGKLLDINVLDHIIVTKDGYHSLFDEGQM